MERTSDKKIKNAKCVVDDEELGVSVWENRDLVSIIVRGVIFSFTKEQFNSFSQLVSEAFLYLNSNIVKGKDEGRV